MRRGRFVSCSSYLRGPEQARSCMSTSPTFIFDSLTRYDVTDFCLAPGVFACCFLTWLAGISMRWSCAPLPLSIVHGPVLSALCAVLLVSPQFGKLGSYCRAQTHAKEKLGVLPRPVALYAAVSHQRGVLITSSTACMFELSLKLLIVLMSCCMHLYTCNIWAQSVKYLVD
jgi:hypothetical protein